MVFFASAIEINGQAGTNFYQNRDYFLQGYQESIDTNKAGIINQSDFDDINKQGAHTTNYYPSITNDVRVKPIYYSTQTQRWEIQFGSPYYDDANWTYETYDKGYYLVGTSNDKAYLAKMDINGNVLYDKTLLHDQLGGSSLFSVVQDSLGNTYVGGMGMRNQSTGYPFIIKLDPCGNPVWCKYFPNPRSNGGATFDMIINDEGYLVALLEYGGVAEWELIFLTKITLDGEVVLKQAYARPEDYPLKDQYGSYRLMQHNEDYYISGYCYYPYPDDPDHVFLRPMFIHVSSTFKELWMKPFHATDSVFGDAFHTIAINDTLLMGVGLRRFFDPDEPCSLLMFYGPNGQEYGYREIPNRSFGPDIRGNDITNILRINDTLFMAIGQYGTKPSANPGGDMVIDTAGNLYHIKSHPQTISWRPGLQKTYDGNYIVPLSYREGNQVDFLVYKNDENLQSAPYDTTQRVYDSLCPHPIESGILDLTDCLVVTDIEELPGPEEYYESIRHIPIKVHPNPVKDGRLTLEFENTTHHQNMQLRCYDSFGRQLHSQKIYKGQQETKLDVSAWSAGMYVAVIYSNGGTCGKVKFVVK